MPASTAGRLRELPPTGLRNPLSRTQSEWAIRWRDLPQLFMVGAISLSLNIS